MAEVLTESFCERCGTRYTFESARPRVKRLKGVKVLSRGLKNFVLSDDSSLDEAMAAARSDTDREVTAQQLDAFHQTFNFCMTCRQYTCANCWNEAEGACLTCAPHLGHEILPAPFPDLDPKAGLVQLDATDATNGNGNGHDHDHAAGNGVAAASLGLSAWPASDLIAAEPEASSLDVIDDVEPIDAAARLAALTSTEPVEATAEAEGTDRSRRRRPGRRGHRRRPGRRGAPRPRSRRPAIRPRPTRSRPRLPRRRPRCCTASALARTSMPRSKPTNASRRPSRPRPRPSPKSRAIEPIVPLAAAVVASEIVEEPVAEAVVDEPVAAEASPTDVEPTAVVASEPEPVVEATEPDVDAEGLAAAAALAAVAAQRTDIVEQPTWQIVAPDVDAPAPVATPPMMPAPLAPNGTQPSAPAGAPEWPVHAQATAGLPFLGRPAQPTGGLESLWAESNREVASAPPAPGRPVQTGVQPCVSCGLSLSATARFCRRCGTSQVA